MNLNLINLPPTEWSKKDWQDAYAQYCQHNMFGPKTKKEYYDMVLERHRLNSASVPPLSDELRAKWSAGRRAAAQWAKKRGCDMNGRLLADVAAEQKQRDMAEMADDITDLFQRTETIRDVLKKNY